MSEHYFSESPSSDFKPRDVTVELGGQTLEVLTTGGVFSPDGVDRGTQVLLRTLADIEPDVSDATIAGPVLDIGCGWGAITLDAALRMPGREIWAIDVNERSRELTRANAERLSLTNVRVAAPDELSADLRFAQIRSNPPIRVGKQVLHGILRQWLPRLTPSGLAYLVVAKHLGADSLQRWIASEFEHLRVSRVAREKGFHVIQAEAD